MLKRATFAFPRSCRGDEGRRNLPLEGRSKFGELARRTSGGGMPHRQILPANRRFAKAMRQKMPEAELRLWLYLRKPGVGGLRFRRQTPIGAYIVDFFCPQRRLIVELDGGQHALPTAQARDEERDAWLGERGYRIVRVWNDDVLTNMEGVAEAILAASRE